MRLIKHYIKSFLLFELLKGMAVTGRYLFARKITIRNKKRPCHLGFVVCTLCVVTQMVKNVVSPVNYAKRYVLRWPLPSILNSELTAPVEPPAMTSICSNAFTVAFVKKPARWIPSWRRIFLNITSRNGVSRL